MMNLGVTHYICDNPVQKSSQEPVALPLNTVRVCCHNIKKMVPTPAGCTLPLDGVTTASALLFMLFFERSLLLQ